jgi:O-methyltransferase
MINRVINKFFRKSNKPIEIETYDPEFSNIYEKCQSYTMTSKERMYSLYKSVVYVVKNNIKGDFVECGVWKGGSSMLIAETLSHLILIKIYLVMMLKAY